MTTKNIEDIYPLSPLQQGMLYHSLLEPGSGVYFEQLSCSLFGLLIEAAFERAWAQVVSRHSVLRTSFAWEDLDEPLQIVQRQVDLPLQSLDWRGVSQSDQAVRLAEFLEREPSNGFDLSAAPLMRITLIRLEERQYKFVWSHHHLLLDGWSMPLLLKEVFELYNAFANGKDLYLPPARPYRDYIGWLQQQDLSKAEHFWRELLKGFYLPTPIMVGRRTVAQAESLAEAFIEKICLDETTTDKLRSVAQQHGLTLNTWIQGAWALLLSRYSGEGDIVFGSTVAGRPASLSGAETMLGLFINTLPVRIQVDDEALLIDWLRNLQFQQVETRQYEYTPLVQVQQWSEVLPGQPLFESILVFENYPVSTALSEQRSSVEIKDVAHFGKTNYPLTLVAAPAGEFELQLVFDPARFDRKVVVSILHHLQNIVLSMLENPQEQLGKIELLAPDERKQIVSLWQGEKGALHENACIHELIKAQAEKTPAAPAVIVPLDESQTKSETSAAPEIIYTYHQLDHAADLLGGYLQSIGFGPGALAGISLVRSFEMLVAVLGVLKAGGAYVPLDPKYPRERLEYMIQDSRIQVLLTTDPIARQIVPDFSLDGHASAPNYPRVVRLDTGWEEIAAKGAAGGDSRVTAQDAAYVIYTSGSTGQPKGVVVSHRALVNHAVQQAETLELGASRRIAQLISFSFDAAGEEIYPTLISGAALVLPQPDFDLTGKSILDLCRHQQVTTLHLPAPLWHQVIDELVAEKLGVPPSLRVVLVGGESPSVEKLRQFRKELKAPIHFINAYGPTETTITAALFKRPIFPAGQSGGLELDLLTQLPIGRPLLNMKVCILDGKMRPLPVGVPGEIYIGGLGVAQGYLHRPELTNEKFIIDPFDHNQRLYRTGDRGQYNSEGQIEFIGRVDYQVKLRGYRVELEEIEAVLAQHPWVKEAAVVVQDVSLQDGSTDKRLVSFVVLNSSQAAASPGLTHPDFVENSRSDIRQFASRLLPDYMIPQAIVILDEMPRLPAGKINRRALVLMPVDMDADWPAGLTGRAIGAGKLSGSALEEIVAGLWVEVLGIEPPDSHVNFFDLGGHSLRATQLLARMRQTFGVDLPLRSLFEAPTVAGMAAAINSAITGTDLTFSLQPIQPVQRDPVNGLPVVPPPLSFSQQRLWFLDQLDPGNLSYNIPAAVRITGELEVPLLEKSLQAVIQRHESLRTTFKSINGKPVQDIAANSSILMIAREVLADDLGGGSFGSIEANESAARKDWLIQEWVEKQVRQPFDLAYGPLLRASILEISGHHGTNGGPPEYILVLVLHHIIADGWSMRILIQEIVSQYASALKGTDLALPPLTIQYADYAEWQREWLSGSELEKQLTYWKERLAGSPPLLDLPTDRPRPAIKSSRGALENFILPEPISQAIQSAARREGVTVYMFLLAAFQTLLYRYSGQDDIAIGTAIANRTRRELEGLVGLFVNTLVMRTDCSGSPSFRELLIRVREVALGAYAHQDLPFEMLVEALQPQRNLSYTPIFQVGFDLQEISEGTLDLAGLTVEALHAHGGTAAFDLLMSVNQSAFGMGGTLEYNTDLFDQSTIQRMLQHFQQLLQSIIADLDQAITSLSYLTDAEREQLLITLNDSDASYPATTSIQQLFEQQAAQNPTATALIFRGAPDHVVGMSYAELNQRANVLARWLRNRGVGPDVIVGISSERSIEMILGILGILKAGGAYLPLDPNYPTDRLSFMLDDSRISILLAHQPVMSRLEKVFSSGMDLSVSEGKLQVVLLDQDWEKIESDTRSRHTDQADQDLPLTTRPDHLAYVIYTSGSTGKPKGTLLRHRGLCNLVEWQRKTFEIGPNSRILQFSPFSFDASVWETFMALANGAALCLATQETLANGLDLVRLIKEQGITTITLPPSLLSVIPAELVTMQELPTLRTVIAAGEACTREIVTRWQAPDRHFFDAYGPTETTVCASAAKVDEDDLRDPPIGRPIANMHLYVVDQFLEPVPLGFPGELLIGGIGVARGYHNRPELSKEKFIANPFAGYLRRAGHLERGRETLYRTGDLVRYRPDGNLEFLGRIDQQVKVRGYRIELGEIEAALRLFSEEMPEAGLSGDNIPPKQEPRIQKLREAVVVARDDQPSNQQPGRLSTSADKKLVAFVLPEIEIDLQDEEETANLIGRLRRHLRQTLPEYMLPSNFVVVNSLPISPSGKIDRRALVNWKLPTAGRGQIESLFEAPRNELENQLCQISADLLGLAWQSGDRSPIGIHDNFFEMGGHSLLATQFISRVRDTFHVELPLRTLFEHPTIADLGEEIEKLQAGGGNAQAPAIQRVAREARRMKQTSAGLAAAGQVNSAVAERQSEKPDTHPGDSSE